jgi:hypothetical protein
MKMLFQGQVFIEQHPPFLVALLVLQAKQPLVPWFQMTKLVPQSFILVCLVSFFI